MAKVERRIDIDIDIWNRILKRFPEASLHVVVNELLFNFDAILHVENFSMSPLYKQAAEDTKETLNSGD